MSKITLKPLDDGQKAVEIPIGKTTIGRGPFLGCSDKKVSRNHAVLEVTDAREVYITPTHVNPCFYQPTAESPGIILKKDKPQRLSSGDSFSLLPRAFRYQLIVTSDTAERKNSNQNDFSIQSEKTNGEANSTEGVLKETKDDAKEISRLENDTAGSKQLPKDEGLSTNTSKDNCLKNNTDSEAKEHDKNDDQPPAKKDLKAEQSKSENNISQNETSNDSKDKFEDLEDEEDYDEDDEDVPITEKDSLQSKEKSEDKGESGDGKASSAKSEKSASEDKVIDENESTLGNDAFVREEKSSAKDGAGSNVKDHDKDAKSEANSSSGNIESGKEQALDDSEEPPKESTNEDEDKSRPLPDWLDDVAAPAKKGGPGRKKGQTAKTPKKEKPPPKRKTDTPPKAKPRKKVASKFDFEDPEEGSSQKRVAERTSSRTNRQTRQGLSLEDFVVSDDDEWQSDQSEPKRRRKRGSGKRGNDSGSDWEVDHKKPRKGPNKTGSGSESGSDWGSAKKKKGLKGKRRKGKTANQSETGSEVEDEPSSSFVAKDAKRIPCTYAKKCYRKNPNHTDQFSHPGDSDYEIAEPEPPKKVVDKVSESEEEEEESEKKTNKKECPYGLNCFRKNPQHKKDFKHTKKVRPQREAAKQASKKAKGSRSSDEVDSYDLMNDSLLNDESEADEYKPVDSGSDYETKGKTKRFTAKGKNPKNKRGGKRV